MKDKKKQKCEGSGMKPIVERPAPIFGNSGFDVNHKCPKCGRLFGRNIFNDGWPDLPIPKHLIDIKKESIRA